MRDSKHSNPKWLKLYSIILIANVLYIIAFYLITKAF